MTNKFQESNIAFRAIVEQDQEFLYQVYASTRLEEMSASGWTAEEIEAFLRQQFDFQHRDYMRNYTSAQFDLILKNDVPVGRLYVHRRGADIRIIDIALLIQHRKKGIGAAIFKDLMAEADGIGATLSLHVEMNNPILPYYERLKFINKGEKGVYYFMERAPKRTATGGINE